jgi:hypothetical protein
MNPGEALGALLKSACEPAVTPHELIICHEMGIEGKEARYASIPGVIESCAGA